MPSHRAELYHNESNRFDFSLQRLTAPLLVINTAMYIYLSVMYLLDFTLDAPWGSGAYLITRTRQRGQRRSRHTFTL